MTTEADITKGIVAAALTDWRMKLRLNDRAKLIECWQNVYTILDNHPEWQGVLALDTFAQRIVKRKLPPFERGAALGAWTPEDDSELGLWLAAPAGTDCFVVKGKQALMDGVSACAARHKFHPVREFIEKCAMPKKARLDTWLTEFLGVKDTTYSRLVGRYFLINMVARVFEPGCIMRSVLVLEGPQNRGKSTALYTLAQPWFADSHFDLQSKDAFEAIQGVWLYEISEMEQFNKADVTRVKQFISSREDNYRPPYERRAQRIPRQVAFAGSTNERRHLKDWTGNTRFWPVLTMEVGDIQIEALAEARDGLLAEAYEAYRNQARRHPTREEEAELFAPEQAERMPEHPWTEPIARWLDDPGVAGQVRDQVTVSEVLHDGLKIDYGRMTTVMERDVGLILSRALGWTQERVAKHRGPRPRYYVRPKDAGEAPAKPAPERAAVDLDTANAEAQVVRSREPGEDDDPIPF